MKWNLSGCVSQHHLKQGDLGGELKICSILRVIVCVCYVCVCYVCVCYVCVCYVCVCYVCVCYVCVCYVCVCYVYVCVMYMYYVKCDVKCVM
jgi:hypothetical protein